MRKTSTARSAVPAELAALGTPEEHELKNGLKVRLLANDAVPTVSYYTFFRVGSRNERPGITGISHLFEHMMFNGAKKYGPGAFDRVLESAGGVSNAYTSNDLTVYHEEFEASALDKVIDLESDRMRSLAISDRMLTSERQVVLEERRMRVDNDTGGMMDEELNALVYKAHPYHWPVLGWEKDIEAITKEDCMQYFRTFYAPNNATLWVVGDIDTRKTLAAIRAAYSDIPKGPPPPKVIDAEPEQKGERRAVVRHPAQAPSLMIAWRAPKATDPDTLALDVVQYALSVDWSWRLDAGMVIVYLELKPGSNPADVEAALYAEIDKVAKDGLTDTELQKAKNNLRASHLRELQTNTGRAHALGNYEVMLGSWQAGLSLPGKYQSITGEAVRAATRKYLSADRRSVVTLVPAAAEASA
jgi:zinc protease